MNIALYAPLKPLGLGAPSGDASTSAALRHFLQESGHCVTPISALRARNIFEDKRMLRQVPAARETALELARSVNADIWLTYHSYWKSPDLLGPWCCDRLGIPYVMHKAMYAQKRRRDRRTLPGFLVNRKALCRADAVFVDDITDVPALEKLLGRNVESLLPGIDSSHFYPDPEAGESLRRRLGLQGKQLVATVAMFRKGVKTQSLTHLLESFSQLDANSDTHLLIAGDGAEREACEALARKRVPGRHSLLGLLGKEDLRALYNAADVFAFPGIRESLGMVYLEAMCCGTPVVAYAGLGTTQLVLHEETGLLSEPYNVRAFARAMGRLLDDRELRMALGRNGRPHVLSRHTLDTNLAPLEAAMVALVEGTELSSQEMK